MMSPQHNAQAAAYYAYNYGYGAPSHFGYSPTKPRRRSPRKGGTPGTPGGKSKASTVTHDQAKDESTEVATTPVLVRKVKTDDSETHQTVATEAVCSDSSE